MKWSILILMLIVLIPNVLSFEENNTIDLSTGIDIADISIPIPKFTINNAENWKYIFEMNQVNNETFDIIGIRLYLLVLIAILGIMWRLSKPIIINK